MRMLSICVILVGWLVVPTLSAAQPVPRVSPHFATYPAELPDPGRHRLVLGKVDLEYRTRLREAAQQLPNFAGHYILALWGCGMECVMGAAIDVRSGHVTWLPGTICCWLPGPGTALATPDTEPVRYRLDSRLLILDGLRNEREGDLGEHYYTIEGRGFVHLLDVPRQK